MDKPSWLKRNWLLLFSLGWGVFVTLPILAPIFMHLGWSGFARLIYGVYSITCHQLPQRSFFLFGPKLTYSLPEIQAAFQVTNNPTLLRQFVGNAELGWKLAWSDRMFSMYTAILPAGWIWYLFRRKLGFLSIWGFAVFLLPMLIDGTSHIISDFVGIGQGFRDSNAWLAVLTNHSFSTSFYSGDALGSFNSLMRMLTGLFFALGIVWFGFPYLEEAINYKGLVNLNSAARKGY